MFKLMSQFTLQRRFLYILLFLLLYLLHSAGIYKSVTRFFKKDRGTAFLWPLNVDIKNCVDILKNGGISNCPVINSYNYSYLSNCETKCRNVSGNPLRLVYIVKSKLYHFKRRSAIRRSWGAEKRFSDVTIRTVFLLGVEEKISELQSIIAKESKIYGDIVQADFVDTYWNNTIKILMGMQWAVKFCNNSRFYVFADDDMYASTKNVLRFLANPFNYSKRFEDNDAFLQKDSELPPDYKFYAGRLGPRDPHRKLEDKWYVSEFEYPFKEYPRFIIAAFYFLSFNALTDLYFGSFYTQYFRIDDVYLGLVADKMDLERFGCSEIHAYKKPYHSFRYRNVIASHGYDDSRKMLAVWSVQKSLGFA